MKIRKISSENIINSIIGLFLLAAYFFGLLVPVTSDAGKYAAISRIIFETGDWINLSIHFEPYLQKPPLLFWVTTPFYFIFGATAFAFKLPVLLYSGIAIYATYRFAKIYYSEKTAKIAAIMLATSEFYFFFHNDIHTDCLLTANVIFALWQFAEYFKSKKLVSALLGGFGVGLAMISKGPIGIFVPAMAVFTHLMYTKQWKTFFSYKIILSGLILLLVLAVGLTGIFKQFGWEGLKFFFWENNAGRISGDIKGNSTDYFFYFHTALYIFLPWGILFFISLFFEIKELFKRKNTELFTLGGIVFYWLIISYARAKAPHYFMVLSPFMAILSAKWMLKFFTQTEFKKMKKAITGIQYATIFFIWILLVALCFYFFPIKNILVVFAFLILLGASVFLRKTESFNKVFKRSLLAIVAVNFALNVHVFPQIFTYQSVLPACKIFNAQAKEGDLLNTYLSEHRELFFYAKYPGHFLYTEKDLQNCLQKPGSWVYTNDEGLNQIQELITEFEVVQSFKHRSISKLTPGFINPATRNERLSNMYLLKINTF